MNRSGNRSSLLDRILRIPRPSPGQLQRGMLVARLIVITSVFNLILTIINLWLWLSLSSPSDRQYFLLGLSGFILLVGVWWINRKGFVNFAAFSLILLYLVRISLVSEPSRFLNSFWAFMIPIMLGSFIFKPFSSLLLAGGSTILYLILSLRIGVEETLDITLYKLFLLFSLAALSYFVASHLDRAMISVNLSEIKFRDLYKNLPIGLYRSSPDGRILDVNPAFLEMFGYPDLATLQTINAKYLYADPQSRAQHLSIVEKYTTTEMQMRKSDGTSFWVTDHVRPIYDQAGKIDHYEGSLIDITKRKQAEQELEQLAITDPLTELPNRRYFFSRAEQIFGQAREPDYGIAVLMIDIDNFKKVNDQYGHAAGDIILHDLAQTLQKHMRLNDLCGRYGGEEFSIILSRIDQSETCLIADRLCRTVSQTVIKVSEQPISITVSIGIAMQDSTSKSLDVLLQRADSALYAAKQAGRNCWRLWEPAFPDRS
jgi:diguanylate cyclase (GGDEF)-like protein/PAS domain S-box-containing protein